jgi:hypothetical protein
VSNEEKSSLVIKCVQRDDFGYYVCKAINDVGDVTTRGKLIESSEAFMTADEISENRKKVEKKLKKKSSSRRSSKSSDGGSVDIEATVRSSRKSSRASKIVGDSNVDASATFKRKVTKMPEKSSKTSEESSELTITKTENIYIQETEEMFIKEVEHKTCLTTITINSLNDINDLKSSNEIDEIMNKFTTHDFGKEKESIRELATVSYMLQNGLSTSEVQKLFQSSLFPSLKTTESQSALVQVLEREGHAKIVSDILSEKSEHEIDENFIATVGFKAFLKMVEMKQMKAEEIIRLITPEDFAANSWKAHSAEV